MVFEPFEEFIFGIMHYFPLKCLGLTKLLAIFSVHWSQVEINGKIFLLVIVYFRTVSTAQSKLPPSCLAGLFLPRVLS